MKTKAVIFFVSLFSLCAQAQGSAHFKKVIYLVFENTNYAEALRQPFFGRLAREGVLLSNLGAETHPSQGNYIAMIAGDTYGIKHDRPVSLPGNHLGDLLEAKGMDWRAYAEGYPGNCFLGATKGAYARKHVPFLSFENVTSSPARCAKIRDGEAFDQDLSAGQLPEFSMYIPDQKNDGHDTGARFADNWFASKFGPLLKNGSLGEDTLMVVTFDENDGQTGNQIYTVLHGGSVVKKTITDRLNHYSLLRLIEDEWGLGTLNKFDARAQPISGIWR